MKPLTLTLLAGAAAAALLSLAPLSMAMADPDDAPAPAVVVTTDHGNWTLKQREEWLADRLDKSRDDGSLDHHEYDRVKHELHDIHEDEERMRDHHDNQLTDNENSVLEARLDDVAAKIHWLRENTFTRPW